MVLFLWAKNRIDSSALWFVFTEMETNYSLNEKSLLTLWFHRKAGSAFYVWLICLRSFSVAQYRPGLLFCILGSTAGSCEPLYLRRLWFGFYFRKLGKKSTLPFWQAYYACIPQCILGLCNLERLPDSSHSYLDFLLFQMVGVVPHYIIIGVQFTSASGITILNHGMAGYIVHSLGFVVEHKHLIQDQAWQIWLLLKNLHS